MKKYIVEKYSKIKYNEWNNFVHSSLNGTFIFCRDYMEYHQDRFEDFSLMIYDDKQHLMAILPANEKDKTVYSHQGLTYGGLVFREKILLEDYLSLFQQLMKYLVDQNFEKLILKPIPNYYSKGFCEEIDYILFLLNAKLIRRDVIALYDISKEPSISRIRKRGVQKGIDNELIVKNDDDFEVFWNMILIPNLETKYNIKPVHSLQEILHLKSKFPDKIKQYNVYYQEKIVAGITIYDMEDIVHPQYVSGNVSLNNTLGSLDFLYHELIHNYYKDRKYLDFGSSNEEMGKKLNKSLHYFKQSFGCETTTQSFYEIELKNLHLLEKIYI